MAPSASWMSFGADHEYRYAGPMIVSPGTDFSPAAIDDALRISC